MGGKAGGIGAIVLGALLIVMGAVTGGSTALLGVMLIASGAMSLAFAPKTPDQKAAVAQELTIAPASVGNPVPVIFGQVRVTPNFMNWSLDHFQAVELFEKPQGGKGGSAPKQSVGFEYYLKWEYGICMGPVDAIGQVIAMPGEVQMNADTWTVFSSDSMDVTLDADNQGGTVRIYRGASDQTRSSSGDVYQQETGMNYRNVCFALMGVGNVGTNGFKMGTMAQPNTYQFMVRRLPKCLRDNGSTVAIAARGSLDSGFYSYHEANPAAVIYELLTNKVWGRGLSSDIIDEDSFILAGEYFATQAIGMSFELDAQESIGDVIEGIRRHLKTILTWDGEKYKLKCLMDPAQTHSIIQTLKSDEIEALEISRPTWDSVTNEVRAEYISHDRSHRTEMVHAQNIAAKDIMGGWITTERLQLSGFSDPTVIGRQLNRILSELSYPYATASWEMNRYKSQIEVGDCVRIVWDEFNASEVTTYWIILRIEDGSSDSENIRVSAIEDQLLAPVAGEELSVTVPTNYAWEYVEPPTGDDTSLHEAPSGITEAVDPIVAFEMPPIVTGGLSAQTLIVGEKTNAQMVAVQGMWSTDGTGFTIFGNSTTFGVTGTLDDAIESASYFDRGAGFLVTMTDVDKKATLLAVNSVATNEDDLETLAQVGGHYVLIGSEIMQVGVFEDAGGDQVRMRHLMRGMFGSKVEAHSASSVLVYISAAVSGFASDDLPQDEDLYFRGYPIGLWNTTYALGSNIQVDGTTWRGLGRRPMRPEAYDLVDGGSDLTIRVRPRWATKGAGVQSTSDATAVPVSTLDGIGFAVEQLDNTGAVIGEREFVGDATWTPATLTGIETGLAELEVAKRLGVVRVKVYQTLNGRLSVECCQFTV